MAQQHIISLEEHFITPDFETNIKTGDTPQAKAIRQILDRCENLGDSRITEMDAAGIDRQIISLTAPATENMAPERAVPLAKKTNDLLGKAVLQYPERFGGFATLPTSAPKEAATELERTVSEYGFSGALINGTSQGRYMDDPDFDPIFAKAESLNVPIYLHPGLPSKTVVDECYRGNFSEQVTAQFSSAGFGWHIETAIHIIHLILGGVFDKHQNLKLVTGHLGEGLMFAVQRLDTLLPTEISKLQHSVSYYLQNNIYYTISGYNSEPQFMELYSQVGADQILFSVDYPYVSMTDTRKFVEGLPIDPNSKNKIFSTNAEKLLNRN